MLSSFLWFSAGVALTGISAAAAFRYLPFPGGAKTSHEQLFHDLPYLFIDGKLQRVFASREAVQLLKLRSQENDSDILPELFGPHAADELTSAVQKVCETIKPVQLTLHTQPDNRIFDACLVAMVQRRDPYTAAVITLNEVTEKRQLLEKTQVENEKLKAELRNYASIFNGAPFPIWQRRGDLSIRFCNLAYSAAVEELPEKIVEVEGLELDKSARQFAQRVIETGTTASERRHIVIEGERKLYQITEVYLPGEEGTIGFAIDISELESLQEELRRHMSAQSDLLESSTSAMAIYGADMRLRFFNNAFVALWKLEESWLDSQPTYGEVLEALREKRRLPEQANFLAFKQSQLKIFTDLIEAREEFFYLPDGKILRVIAIPHALGGILFAYEDVTDRLALERSYNTLIAVQRATLDNLHEGVAVFGENGRLQLSNPVFWSLWQVDEKFREEPHLADILDVTRHLYQKEDWDGFKGRVLGMAQQRHVTYERLERTDGSVIDWSSVPLPDGATLMTYYDVTDSTLLERSLREKNEALEEADRLKSEFLANVSYELRSPLTSIIGFSEMLKQNYFGKLNDKQLEYVDNIFTSSQNLMSLINNILDLASIEAGYLKLDITRFNIHSMLASVLSLTTERAKKLGISMSLTTTPQIGEMEGDETRIKQVLFSLISNAMKFTEPGGRITLSASAAENGMMELWVEDTGIGIPESDQPQVFTKFFRGQGSGRNRKSGAGLGLSIVRSFIHLHYGSVELVSSPDQGTKVVCRMPRYQGENDKASLSA